MENTSTLANESLHKPMTPEEAKDIDSLINSIMEEISHVRQLSLASLIKPFAETQPAVKIDRSLAEALAELYVHQGNLFLGIKIFWNVPKSQIFGLLRYWQKERISMS